MAAIPNQANRASRLLDGRRIVLAGLLNAEAAAIEDGLRAAGADVERYDLQRWWPNESKPKPDAVVLRIGGADEDSHGALRSGSVRHLVRSTIEEEPTVVLIDESALAEIDDCDFVLPPFRPIEVVSRIERALHLLRPQEQHRATEVATLTAGGITVDLERRMVIVDGHYIDLTYSEFEILTTLVAADGRAVSRTELLGMIRDGDTSHATRLTSHIYRLRTKLGSEGKRIKTLHEIGYQLLSFIDIP